MHTHTLRAHFRKECPIADKDADTIGDYWMWWETQWTKHTFYMYYTLCCTENPAYFNRCLCILLSFCILSQTFTSYYSVGYDKRSCCNSFNQKKTPHIGHTGAKVCSVSQ